jgi:hypothetical protein
MQYWISYSVNFTFYGSVLIGIAVLTRAAERRKGMLTLRGHGKPLLGYGSQGSALRGETSWGCRFPSPNKRVSEASPGGRYPKGFPASSATAADNHASEAARRKGVSPTRVVLLAQRLPEGDTRRVAQPVHLRCSRRVGGLGHGAWGMKCRDGAQCYVCGGVVKGQRFKVKIILVPLSPITLSPEASTDDRY